MTEYYAEEYSPIVRDMQAGLQVALSWTDSSVSVPAGVASDSTHDAPVFEGSFVGVPEDLVWADKLVVAAIREIGQDVTVDTEDDELPFAYSWFRYGRATPINEIRPQFLEPQIPSDFTNMNFYQSSYGSGFPSPEEFAIFFEQRIEQMDAFDEESNLYEFLQSDYEDEPEQLGGLYPVNLRIQRKLSDLYHIHAGVTPESDGTDIKSIASEARPIIDEYERKVRRSDIVGKQLTETTISYLDSLRDLLIGLEGLEDIVRPTEVEIIHDFVRRYHGNVWRWTAHLASTATVDETKPCSDQLVSDNDETIRSNSSSWSERVDTLSEELSTARIDPSLTDFGTEVSEEMQSAFGSLETGYLN